MGDWYPKEVKRSVRGRNRNQENNQMKGRSRGYTDTVREEGKENFATQVEEGKISEDLHIIGT